MRGHGIWRNDWALRVAGLLAMVVGTLAIRHLHFSVRLPPRHDATAFEMALAAIGFIGLSPGSVLVCLGAHIFDEVEVAPLWSHRPLARPAPPIRHPDQPPAPPLPGRPPWADLPGARSRILVPWTVR